MNNVTDAFPINLTLASPDRAPMIAAEEALAAGKALTIATREEYASAAHELKAIKARAADLENIRKGLVAPLNEAHARIQALFRGPANFLAEAERIIKSKMLTFSQEEERAARAAAAAEEARLRKLAEARADRAEKRGDEEAAQEHRIAAQTTVVTAPRPVAVAGISTHSRWSAELVDLRELCKAVVEGHAPPSLVMLNQTEADRMASALKDALRFPGLRAKETKGVTVRGA